MPTQEEVLTALKDCYDPEIPVNIVDLGLIYEVRIAEGRVEVDMTLTAPGCPAHVSISEDVKRRLMTLPEVKDAAVNIVWTPQWTPERLSPAAKEKLGI